MRPSLIEILQEIGVDEPRSLFEKPELREKFLALVKRKHSYDSYYHDRALRSLLFELIPYINSIPQEIRDLLATSPNERLPKERFIEDWEADGVWPVPTPKRIDAKSFLDFIRKSEAVTRPFSERNLHNSAYFYSKLMEWYLSCLEIQENKRTSIVDIGSAYFGFGKIAEGIPCVEKIFLVDIHYPQGAQSLTPKTVQIGSNASRIEELEDNSIDLVTLHNAIEHFTNGADEQCIGEISRILKPGGKAIIAPLFFEARFAISLNPISAFYFLEDHSLLSHILAMRNARQAVVRLSKTMLSPYAHIYDYPSLKKILLAVQSDLEPTLGVVAIKTSREAEYLPANAFGVPFNPQMFTDSPFYFLELQKPNEI